MGFILIVLTIIFGIHASFVFFAWGPSRFALLKGAQAVRTSLGD